VIVHLAYSMFYSPSPRHDTRNPDFPRFLNTERIPSNILDNMVKSDAIIMMINVATVFICYPHSHVESKL